MGEVTDEMVERYIAAASAAYERVFKVTCKALNGNFDVARAGLEAALNPPQEPEIVVTGEQATAGYEVANMWVRQKGCIGTSELYCMAKDIYRAMRRLEPPK